MARERTRPAKCPGKKWVWKIGMVFRQPPFRFLTNNNTGGVWKKVDPLCLREDDAPLAVGAASMFLRLVYLRCFCDCGSDEASAA